MFKSRRFWLIAALLTTLSGCGGTTSQQDMMRMAISRSSDEDEDDEDVTAPAPSISANQTDNEADVPVANPQVPTGVEPPTTTRPNSGEASPQVAGDVPKVTLKGFPPEGPVEESEEAYEKRLAVFGQVLKGHIEDKKSLPQSASYSGARPLLSWRVHLLPLMGYGALYSQFVLDEPWDSPANKALLEFMPEEFYTGASQPGYTCVQVPNGSYTMFSGNRPVFAKSVEDGLDHTAMVLLVAPDRAVPWTSPEDYKADKSQPSQGLAVFDGDHHLVVWGSGDVTRISSSASPKQYLSMLTIDAGEAFLRSDVEYQGAMADPVASVNPTMPAAGNLSDTTLSGLVQTNPSSGTRRASASLSGDLERVVIARMDAGELDHTFDLLDLSLLVDAGEGLVDQMKWVPALKRPVVVPRVGIGVECPLGPRFQEGPEPFRSDAKSTNVDRASQDPVVDKLLGDFGNEVMRMMVARQQAGDWGPWAQGDKSSSSRGRNSGGDYGSRAVRPGIDFLGNNTRKNLMEVAQTRGVDLLLFFEVKLQKTRQGTTHNTTTLTIFDVVKNEPIFQTDPVNNIQTYVATQDPTQRHPLALALNEFDKWTRNELVMTTLPELKPEQIRQRMDLAEEEVDGTSWDLALEARLYYQLGLISRIEYEVWVERFTGATLEKLKQSESSELLETLLETRDPEFARLTREALENPPELNQTSVNDDD
jgi:hypothetical protein